MDKNTKLLLGLGLVGIGAFMLMNSKKPKPTASFSGSNWNDVVGNRTQSFVGEIPENTVGNRLPNFSGADELPVKDSGWVRADGVQEFYDLKDSRWVRYGGDPEFFDVKNQGWVRG